MQKSNNVFKIWSEKKEGSLRDRFRQKKEIANKLQKEEQEKKDKKKDSEIAFREWLRIKEETDKEKKEEALKTERKSQKLKRKENDKAENKKPPVPYDAWLVFL